MRRWGMPRDQGAAARAAAPRCRDHRRRRFATRSRSRRRFGASRAMERRRGLAGFFGGPDRCRAAHLGARHFRVSLAQEGLGVALLEAMACGLAVMGLALRGASSTSLKMVKAGCWWRPAARSIADAIEAFGDDAPARIAMGVGARIVSSRISRWMRWPARPSIFTGLASDWGIGESRGGSDTRCAV